MISITLTSGLFSHTLKKTCHQMLILTMYQPIDIPLCA